MPSRYVPARESSARTGAGGHLGRIPGWLREGVVSGVGKGVTKSGQELGQDVSRRLKGQKKGVEAPGQQAWGVEGHSLAATGAEWLHWGGRQPGPLLK